MVNLQLAPKNEDAAENISSSETELSDTESTHQAMSLSSPEDGPHLGSEKDFDVNQKSMERKNVAPEFFARQRPRLGSSPESEAEEKATEDEEEVDAEKAKLDKDALAEEDISDYVTSCNLRGPSRHNVKKAERLILGLMSTPKLARTPEESDEQYTRRVRKHNFLSLAQEFVARNRSQGGPGADNQMVLPILASGNSRLPHDGHSDAILQEEAREWAKNVKNSAKREEASCIKRRPFNFESLSLNDGTSSPLFLPVNSVLGGSSANQNAIHRYHQRSLAQYDSCLSKERDNDASVPPVQCKNAKVADGEREPANRPKPSHADLPANMVKLARESHREGGGGGGGRKARKIHHHHAASNDGPPANAGKRNWTMDGQFSHSDCDLPSYRSGKMPSPPQEILGGFDVYNIETAMPSIDWIAMEEHLAKAAKEEVLLHKHLRNNREEIRRKLAMDSDTEDYYGGERMSRKPSLQARLQSGMNLQICFMNETASDPESINICRESFKAKNKLEIGAHVTEKGSEWTSSSLPGSLSTPENLSSSSLPYPQIRLEESKDGLTKQALLQAEARLALAQAKQMAHMQMEVEKQRKKKSPIAEMVGIPFPDGRHKVSRHALMEMNVAQLQVIVNDLHTQIENLNEELVRLLLERDDLHMEQDSMLVDIEDLTRYL